MHLAAIKSHSVVKIALLSVSCLGFGAVQVQAADALVYNCKAFILPGAPAGFKTDTQYCEKVSGTSTLGNFSTPIFSSGNSAVDSKYTISTEPSRSLSGFISGMKYNESAGHFKTYKEVTINLVNQQYIYKVAAPVVPTPPTVIPTITTTTTKPTTVVVKTLPALKLVCEEIPAGKNKPSEQLCSKTSETGKLLGSYRMPIYASGTKFLDDKYTIADPAKAPTQQKFASYAQYLADQDTSLKQYVGYSAVDYKFVNTVASKYLVKNQK